MTKYDNWNEWYLAERQYLDKRVVDYVIHPAGLEGRLEWFNTGKRDANYTIDEIDLKLNQSVLEYGCGNGRILQHLTGYESYGVDIVEDFVKEAVTLDCKAFLLEDFEKTVDKVYSLTVFIHLRHEQARTALKYIRDHLKDGGHAYIQALIYNKDKDARNFSDMTCYKKSTFRTLCEECGFEVVELFENEGDIDNNQFGANHNKYQVLKKT